jgi:predicted transcriptional regulator YheO
MIIFINGVLIKKWTRDGTVMVSENKSIIAKLTATDKTILETYKQLVEGLSDYLGDGYEIVLHSLENLDHSAIKVINGYHTGRTEGAPITDLALDMNGDSLKSSTIAIPGENGNIIGLLCINLYLNTSFVEMLRSFVPATGVVKQHKTENFMNNVDDMLEYTVSHIKCEVFDNPSIQVSNKNKIIISRLCDRGVFNIKDSVSKTAELLGISKNTVYMHLRNIAK